MKKLPIIFISAIIIVSVAAMLFFIIEPHKRKRHNIIAEKLFERAEEHYNNKRFMKALDYYKKIVDRYHRSEHTFVSLQRTVGIYDLTRKRLEQRDYLKKFLKFFGNAQKVAPYIYKLGEVELVFIGSDENSQKYFQIVSERFPETKWSQKADIKLAELAHRAGNLEEAIRITEKTIAQMPPSREKDFLFLKNAEAYWRLGNHEKSYENIKKINDPTAAFVENNLIFNQIMVRFSPTYENYINLANAYKRLGFKERAEILKKMAQEKK